MAAAAAAIKRLAKEKEKLDESRVREFYTCPLADIFEWHFTMQGPDNSPYEGGLYHGVIRFPRNYPLAPPDIIFLTNSGRFEVGTKICSSISSFHPELWQPAYNIELVLVALRLFMAQDEELGVGSLRKRYVTPEEKRRLAKESHHFSCAACGMSSAWEVWKTQMEQYPPVSPGVGANLPRVMDQPQSNVEAPAAGDGEVEAASPDGPVASASPPAAASTALTAPATADVTKTMVERHAGNSHVGQGAVVETATAAQVTTAYAGSRVGSEAGVETETEREEASPPAVKCRAPATETKTTTQTKEEPQPHPQRWDEYEGVNATRYRFSSNLSEAPGQHMAGEEASPVVVPASPEFFRIHVGDWVQLRVQLRKLDALITICAVVFMAMVLKKCYWP
ncbi:ubiquitin-conjugating enzyme [Trypanosoma rangeli]|uniref:Ubiquitin-conjugating enzyme n=1 Tax=Trypanosoma rangeli TaxID=5698 RepID=A0A422NBM6_TRYRA|nr:ubiquitin-conjugating enzyme [Trypanosoma rangeli]RNF02875.1 ubiquitin-conjugating enzyme [Trypanosoma rangeli]|eukprot:RNF02875.1 ubiquitin-conjugating enzyme [Trypanosoma rangeli]